jgi:Na+-driven multidrug efflux pump
MQLFFVTALALDSVAIAGQAMIGTLLGANRVTEAGAIGRRLVWWGVALGVAASVLVVGLRPWIPDLFTNDAAVIDATFALVLLLGLMQPIAGAVFALDGILIGAGDMRFLARAMVANSAMFVGGVAIVNAIDGGVTALWVAIVAFIAVRAVTLGWRILGDDWLTTGATRN